MTENLFNSLVAIFSGIAGVALVAVLVSRNSDTKGIVSSLFGGYADAITAANAPVRQSSGFSGITGFGN